MYVSRSRHWLWWNNRVKSLYWRVLKGLLRGKNRKRGPKHPIGKGISHLKGRIRWNSKWISYHREGWRLKQLTVRTVWQAVNQARIKWAIPRNQRLHHNLRRNSSMLLKNRQERNRHWHTSWGQWRTVRGTIRRNECRQWKVWMKQVRNSSPQLSTLRSSSRGLGRHPT